VILTDLAKILPMTLLCKCRVL